MVEYFAFDEENSEYIINIESKFYRFLFIKDGDLDSNIGKLYETSEMKVKREAKPLSENEIPNELEESLKKEHPSLF